MVKKLLIFFMLLAMAIPLMAGEQTVVINRNEGQFEESNGVYYCYKSGLMMTFTSGMNNPNYLVEHQQVYFEVMSVNTSYIIKKIVFHCVDNTLSNNLDCFYWGPTTISIVQNFYNQSAPGTYTASGYTGTWRGETNHIQFTTMAKPVRFGSVEITYEKETGDVYDLVTSDSQLQAGEKYVIVNQSYDMALSTAKTTCFTNQETMDAVGISFVDDTKMKVIINPEVQIFTLRESGGTTRPWLLQLTGSANYLRRNSEMKGTANYNTGYALYYEGLNETYSPVRIKIGDANGDPYNARIRFKRDAMLNDNTDTCAISYVNSYTYFRTVAYSSWNRYESSQRVYMYMPARNYVITTECDPVAGGFITLGEGVLEINGDQTSQQFQTVRFFVGTNEGYGVNSVTATDANGNPVALTCTSQGATGNNYTMVMPAADVHIVATFADPHEIHTNCTPEYGGEFTFNSGAIDVNNQVLSNEGKTVNFSVDASLGYVFTGLTCTDDVTGNEIALTDNGDGTYSFTMPGNDVTLSATFDRVIGDIFELVTNTNQIVEGNTYIIVSQYHDKVMKHWNKSETTFQGTPIVEWPLGVNDKSKVRVDDNACFFRLDACTYTADPKCSAYMNTLVGYLGYSGSNLVSTPDNSGYNRARMYISENAYNYLCAFDVIDPSLSNIAIRYEDATNSFKMINYSHSSDERVWLYKLAETYHNISTVCNPPEGGSITNVATSAEMGDNVTFTVVTNPDYQFVDVTVTYTDGTAGTITVNDNGNGNYSFTMPDNAVTITANFEALYNITSTCDPTNGGAVNINNNGAAAMSASDAEVNVLVTTSWGYRITSVEAVNIVTGEPVQLTTVSSSDAGNVYSFTMPAADVRIDAKFHKNLFLLGTAMGRTSWVPAGPELSYDPENECYYIDAYFKGVGNDKYGYFSFSTGIDPSVDWTDNSVTTGNWGMLGDRLAGDSNPTVLTGNDSNMHLQSQYPDNAFKVPAGVYRIYVNKDMTQMSIEQIPLHLYFDPVSETTVTSGQVVTISSDLQSTVHAIANSYGINEENQQFANTTNNWATQENDNTAVITQEDTTYVNAAVWIGHIGVNDYAVYYIPVVATYTVTTTWSPRNGGNINLNGTTLPQTVTVANGTQVEFRVYPANYYKLASLTVINETTGQEIIPDQLDVNHYTFTMPAGNVTITATFEKEVFTLTTRCVPENAGFWTKGYYAGIDDGIEAPDGEYEYEETINHVCLHALENTLQYNAVYEDRSDDQPVFYIPTHFVVEKDYDGIHETKVVRCVYDSFEAGIRTDYLDPNYSQEDALYTVESINIRNYQLNRDDCLGLFYYYDGDLVMPGGDVTITAYFVPATTLKAVVGDYGFEDGDTVMIADDLIGAWSTISSVWVKDMPRYGMSYSSNYPMITDGVASPPYVDPVEDIDFESTDTFGNTYYWNDIPYEYYNEASENAPTLNPTVNPPAYEFPQNHFIDYMRNEFPLQHSDWDESNWLRLDFSRVVSYLDYINQSNSTAYQVMDLVRTVIKGAIDLSSFENPYDNAIYPTEYMTERDYVKNDFGELQNPNPLIGVLHCDGKGNKKGHCSLDVIGPYWKEYFDGYNPEDLYAEAIPESSIDERAEFYPGYVNDPLEESASLGSAYNHYSPSNFDSRNLGGPVGRLNPTYGQNSPFVRYERGQNTDLVINYFFLPPKDQEIAQVWAVYVGKMNAAPNTIYYGFGEGEIDTLITPASGNNAVYVFEVLDHGVDPSTGELINPQNFTGHFLVTDWSHNRKLVGLQGSSELSSMYGLPIEESFNEIIDVPVMFHVAIGQIGLNVDSDDPGDDDLDDGPDGAPRRDDEILPPAGKRETEFHTPYIVYPLDLPNLLRNAVTSVPEVMDVNPASTLIESIRYYNIMGQESLTPFDGINIVVTRYQDGHCRSRKILR